MLEKIKAQLKAKLQTLGVKNLSNTRINAIADKLAAKITEESEIDAKLDELNELFPFADLAKQDDRLRTLEAKANKDNGQQQQQNQDSNQQQSADHQAVDLPDWAKAMKQELDTLKAEKAKAELSVKFKSKLSEKKIPELLAKNVTIQSEEELENVITQIESDYIALKQQLINDGLAGASQPIGATVNATTVDADIAAWAAKK